MSDADIIHVNYKGIIEEMAKLQIVEKNLADKLPSFMVSLRELTLKLEPALKRESR